MLKTAFSKGTEEERREGRTGGEQKRKCKEDFSAGGKEDDSRAHGRVGSVTTAHMPFSRGCDNSHKHCHTRTHTIAGRAV